jgi:phosphomannomutase
MNHAETGLYIGDPLTPPFPPGYRSGAAARKQALKPLILSASGWRKIFAPGGDEESRAEEITLPDRELAAAMAETFSLFLRSRTEKPIPCLALGTDSRYTGPRIAEIMIRVFILRQIEVRYLFISPAPEIMAWAGTNPEIDGFAYVSASHNPVGHNGVKFGLGGGVLGGEDSCGLIKSFQKLTADNGRMEKLIGDLTRSAESAKEKLMEIFRETVRWKKEAEASYEAFIRRVISGRDEAAEQEAALRPLRAEIQSRGCGIVAELNGSARTRGIDKKFLENFGAALRVVNGRPREISHRIVPEGESLDLCRRELEAARRENPAFIFGYVPDNDGDRGNIVFWDEREGRARSLEAQEVFALACAAELAFLAAQSGTGRVPDKTALAVNDPTSLRIDRIAALFGAQVFRAEVGEANVVALAKKLRARGCVVPILGEGSNGGLIIHPSEVRDPLCTVFALLKLLYLPNPAFPFPLFPDSASHFPLSDIIDSLPRFQTLSSFEPEALLKIRTEDHRLLKERYENIFLREWEARKKTLEGFGFFSWEEMNYEGIEARSGMGKAFRSRQGRGGLSILLKDRGGLARAFLWMRGSGTEPVFRVCVDLEGNNRDIFAYLLEWHTGMVREADESGRAPAP